MAEFSTEITHGTNPSPSVSTFDIPFKSKWAGDRDEISYFKFRSIEASSNEISGDVGAVDAGSLDALIGLNRRPPLSHAFEGGMVVSGGNGSVKVTPASSFYSVSLLMRPLATTWISTTNSLVTFTSAAGGYNVSTTGATAYINGAVWSGTQPFPYSRLVTITFTSLQSGDLQIGNQYGQTDAVGPIQFDYLGFGQSVNGSGDPVQTTAADVARHATLFYRKPNAETVLTDSEAIGPVSDNLVSLPKTWIIVSS